MGYWGWTVVCPELPVSKAKGLPLHHSSGPHKYSFYWNSQNLYNVEHKYTQLIKNPKLYIKKIIIMISIHLYFLQLQYLNLSEYIIHKPTHTHSNICQITLILSKNIWNFKNAEIGHVAQVVECRPCFAKPRLEPGHNLATHTLLLWPSSPVNTVCKVHNWHHLLIFLLNTFIFIMFLNYLWQSY